MVRHAVVDTSVAFKWLITDDETSIREANALLEQQHRGELQLVAPSLLSLELANALRYRLELTADDTLALIDELPSLALRLFAMTTARVGAATALSYQHGISVYDALFLQLAEELDCPLVTADRRAFARIDTPVEIRLL